MQQRHIHDGQVERHQQHDRRDEESRQHQSRQDAGEPRLQDRERIPARRGDDDLDEPGSDRDPDRVEEVAVDVDPRPRCCEKTQVEAVGPQRHRHAQRVLGRRDGRFGQPEQRAQSNDEKEDQCYAVYGPERPPHPPTAPVGRGDDSSRVLLDALSAAGQRSRSHDVVLQDRVSLK